MHLKQPGLTYSAYGPFTENKKMIKKIKETSDSRYTYQKEQDKTCTIGHMDILRIYLEEQRLIKYYVIEHLTLPKNQNMMDIKRVLLRCKFLIKSL